MAKKKTKNAATKKLVAQSSPPTPLGDGDEYIMSISRMTVDKLGVRLYDTVSAVVAELVANGYDADAEHVRIEVPLASQLSKRGTTKGSWVDLGYAVEVQDDGHGMTPKEAREYFLQVGRERRTQMGQGALSRKFRRPVMGRKGIGKLAPFGICRRIEVISAGGPKISGGYRTSHFVMDYERIVTESDEPVTLDRGDRDQSVSPDHGTTIRLTGFLGKRVPDSATFLRQLARRFSPTSGFDIKVVDSAAGKPTEYIVGPLDVPIQEATKIELSARPVTTEAGDVLQVTGWLALAKEAYKDEETTGVRIYARGKIVAWTRDFEQPAGYTGEFTMRSYLVGEVYAEWLDLDEGDDLIRTDRQGIIWDSEYGNALRRWGAALIKEMGATSRAPRRQRVRDLFLKVSDIEVRAQKQYKDKEIVDAAVALAEQIGAFAAEDELTDANYVAELSEVILNVAPHTALVAAFKAFEAAVTLGNVSLDKIENLFSKTRVAEMASAGQVAWERVRAIKKLERLILEVKDEVEFQNLLADAPWLIEAEWSVLSANEGLKVFRDQLQHWLRDRRGITAELAIRNEKKRPDFTLADIGRRLRIVEIKASGHEFDDNDCARLLNYIEAFDAFFAEHSSVREQFPNGYRITVVADGEKISLASNRIAYASLKEKEKVDPTTWLDFLARTRKAHEDFLRVVHVDDGTAP